MPKPTNSPLTEREHEVALAFARGLTRTQIADMLCIEASTVDSHRIHALRKLQCGNNVHLVLHFIRQGWLVAHDGDVTVDDVAFLRAHLSLRTDVEYRQALDILARLARAHGIEVALGAAS